MQIFDRKLLKIKKNLAFKNTNDSDFLKTEISLRLLERLDEIKQDFPLALNLNCELGEIAKALENNPKVGKLFQSDLSIEALQKNSYPYKINIDEENLSAFKSNSFDLVIAPFSLNTINNLDNVFSNIYRILKKNGLFIGSFLTYGSLDKFQEALFETEMNLYKRVSPMVHPFSDIKTLGNILQRNNFAEIVADSDNITIMYKEFNDIFQDLKKWGNSNVLFKRNDAILGKDFFRSVKDNFEKHKDRQTNHYPIEIKFCNLMGWKI